MSATSSATGSETIWILSSPSTRSVKPDQFLVSASAPVFALAQQSGATTAPDGSAQRVSLAEISTNNRIHHLLENQSQRSARVRTLTPLANSCLSPRYAASGCNWAK